VQDTGRGLWKSSERRQANTEILFQSAVNVTACCPGTKIRNKIRHKIHSATRRCIDMVIWKLQTDFRCHCIQVCREFGYNAVDVSDIVFVQTYQKQRKRAYITFYRWKNWMQMEDFTYLNSMVCKTTDDEELLWIPSYGASVFTTDFTKARHWAIFWTVTQTAINYILLQGSDSPIPSLSLEVHPYR
jgi:hypothetical protein